MFSRFMPAILFAFVGMASLPVYAATQGSPSSAVGGSFKVGNDNAVCDSSNEGALRYSSAGSFDACDGTSWTTIATSGGASGTVDVQTFAASGTWTKPSGAQRVQVYLVGGGGGGGSGRRGAAASGRSGGGGGGGGLWISANFARLLLGPLKP